MNRNIFAILTLIAVTTVNGFHEGKSHEDDFKQFKKLFKKEYRNSAHEAKSFQHFKETRSAIIAHNKRHDVGEVHYRLAINERADWSPEDHARINNFVPRSIEELKKMPQHQVKGPKRMKRQTAGPILGYNPFDWRTYGVVLPVRNQGGCGTCWIFAELDAISSGLAIQTNTTPVMFSTQAVDDCDYANTTFSLMEPGKFVMKYGVTTETQYPYMAGTNSGYCVEPSRNLTGYVGKCQMWDNNVTLTQPYIDNVNRNTWGVCAGCNPPSEAAMVDGIINGGPLEATLTANCLGYSFYGSGIIYQSNCSTGVNHAVLLVGVDVQTVTYITPNFTCTTESIPYYILKNSWGTDWGQNGYAKLAVGTNELKIGTGGIYATMKTPPSAAQPAIDSSAQYHIVNADTGTAMDTNCSSQCVVVANSKQSVQSQLWLVQPYQSNTSYYTITNVAQGQCLSIPTSTSWGTQFILVPCTSTSAPDTALFSLQWIGNQDAGTGWVVSTKTSSWLVNLAGGNSKNNTSIIAWKDSTASNNEKWAFVV